MIPFDHPIYQFPYNLEDRVKNRIDTINKLAGQNIDIVIKKNKDQDKNIIYVLTFNNEKHLLNIKKDLENIGCKLDKSQWTLLLE